jgi:hypothetical protein
MGMSTGDGLNMKSTPATCPARPSRVVFLTVLTVEPGAADELIAHFGRATEAVICRLPDFISANLHRSKDGTRVATPLAMIGISNIQSRMSGASPMTR